MRNDGLSLIRCVAFGPAACPRCGARVMDMVGSTTPEGVPCFVCKSCSEFQAFLEVANQGPSIKCTDFITTEKGKGDRAHICIEKGLSMAISQVCQFELKEEVDKLKSEHPDLSLAECIRQMVHFYADAGIEVKEETAKKKYQRATQALGTNVPTPSTPSTNDGIQEKPSEEKKQVEVKRDTSGRFEKGTPQKAGPGRKPKNEERDQMKQATTTTMMTTSKVAQLD